MCRSFLGKRDGGRAFLTESRTWEEAEERECADGKSRRAGPQHAWADDPVHSAESGTGGRRLRTLPEVQTQLIPRLLSDTNILTLSGKSQKISSRASLPTHKELFHFAYSRR